MSHVVTNKFKYESSIGGVDLSTDTLKIALIDNIFIASSDDQISDINYFSAISADWESTGTGYTAGGAELSAADVYQDNINNRVIFSASDVAWNSSSISAYGAIIYRPTDSLAIVVIDFGSVKRSVNSPLDISWSSNGIMNLI